MTRETLRKHDTAHRTDTLHDAAVAYAKEHVPQASPKNSAFLNATVSDGDKGPLSQSVYRCLLFPHFPAHVQQECRAKPAGANDNAFLKPRRIDGETINAQRSSVDSKHFPLV